MEHFVRYQKYWLWGIIFATLAASLAYSFYFKIKPIVDARAYDNIAWDFAQGKGYSTTAENRPGPGYELFLGVLYKIFGHYYAMVWIIQAILLACSAWFVFQISRLVTGQSWHPLMGLFAAALIGFSPDLITISSMLMVETFFIFLMTGGIYFFLRHFHSDFIFWLVPAATFIAVATLTRSNILFLTLPLIGFLFYKKEYKSALLFLFVFLVFLTPWTIRNYRVYGDFRPFNVALAIIWVGNNPQSNGELGPYPLPSGYDFSKMPQLEADKILQKAGTDYILSHPIDFLKKTFWRTSIYFSIARPFAFWPHLQGFWRLATIGVSSFYSAIIFSFGLAGFIIGLSRKTFLARRDLLLLLFLALLTAPIPLIFLIVETRYRFPSYPFLAAAAGIFLYSLFARRRLIWSKIKVISFVCLALLGNTVFDVVRNFSRIQERL